MTLYRTYRIEYRPKPVPTTAMDWIFWHDGYDGAPDSGDARCGFAASEEEAKRMIDEMQEQSR